MSSTMNSGLTEIARPVDVKSGKKRWIWIISLVTIFLAGFIFTVVIFRAKSQDAEISPENETEPGETVPEGISRFAADFYKAAQEEEGGKSRNWVFSPFSLSALFAMLKVGTRGATSRQLQKSFYLPPNDETGQLLASEFAPIIQKLNRDGGPGNESSPFILTVVNRLYIDRQFRVLNSYLNILQSSFDSGIERLNLNPAAALEINKWVANLTHNKIKDLISPEDLSVSLNSQFVLVSAIYFSGKWATPFRIWNTRDQNFYLSDQANDSIVVKMMHQKKRLNITYLEDLDADLFLLPYKGGRFFMVVVLPRTRGGLSKVESNLKSIPTLSQIRPQLKASAFEFAFPKFHIESTIDATRLLPKVHDQFHNLMLGVTLIFSGKADFSGLTANEYLTLSKAVQKAIIIVDEEGTEAAAASYGRAIKAGMPVRHPDLIVDHPFYYQIVDGHNSDLILFAGSCTHPTQTR